MRSSAWKRIPARRLDRRRYGRTQRAYRRGDGALLLLHRPRSRNARWHDRVGTWSVILGGVLVRRRHVYARRARAAPMRWANAAVRAHRVGYAGQACLLLDGRRPTPLEGIVHAPVCPDELPAVLLGPRLDLPAPPAWFDPPPLALAAVPPQRTVRRDLARSVLSRAELALYAETRSAWLASHPEYDEDGPRQDLHVVCIEVVLQYRLSLLPTCRALLQLYHASDGRYHAARRRLRRAASAPCGGMNIAVIVGMIGRR